VVAGSFVFVIMPPKKDSPNYELWKKKIGDGNRGKKRTKEWKEWFSKNHPLRGKHHSPETTKKINEKRYKQIICDVCGIKFIRTGYFQICCPDCKIIDKRIKKKNSRWTLVGKICKKCGGIIPKLKSPHQQICKGCLVNHKAEHYSQKCIICDREFIQKSIRQKKCSICSKVSGRGLRKKRIRFEIFKRDNFTCQYCGRKAPNVELQIDHIIPKSKGGKDIPENLITACWDCNIGKSDVLL